MRKLTMFTLLALWAIGLVHAAEFFCPSGDVSCLIAAINKANRNDQQNTIFLEPGNYILLAVDNRSLDDGATGLPIVTGTITIWGAGAESTTIERDADAAEFRIFHVAATGNLTLEKLTIRGGSTVLFVGGLSEVGGGILNQGIIAIGHSIVLDNIARRNGSIFNLGGTMTINNSIIFDNSGGSGSGGGIANTNGTVSVDNSTIARNAIGNGAGGGISNLSSGGIGTMTITNSTISENAGFEEGAGGILNTGTMTIKNSTVALNRISFFDGGGIRNSGILAIVNSTISANNAGNRFGLGGGIFNFSTGSVELTNVILAMNRGTEGPDCSGRITSRGNNLIGDISGCDINLLPTDLVGDPGLGEFNDDAPPGQGHFPLLSNSQARDRGNPEACPKLDQLGLPRLKTCDIGSVEFQGGRLLVSVDIRPRSDANKINPNSTKNINVAILSGNGFDARTIDPNTIRFGARGTEAAPIHVGRRDVGGDGDRDMVVRFQIQDTGIKCGDISAVLTGQISNGPSIIGSSPIRTVQC
jgi:hypothetical protein